MAGKGIKGINIKLGADTTGLDTALKNIEATSRKTNSELREINYSLKNNNNSVVLWKQKQELLTTAVEESRKKLDFLRASQEQIEKQFANGEIDEGQYRAFQREVENANRQLNNFENQLQQANGRVKELGSGVEDLNEDLGESGQQAENSAKNGYTVLGNVFANLITEGIKLTGTALKDFTRDVVTTGMEYESAISNVAAISGAMSEEVEMLQAKAEEMGATTKFTAAESAEAMSYMAMAGWKVNDMISGLDGIMDLSAASGEDLASVSDIVTDALTAFGLQAEDAGHFADVLAAASSNANTNVSMMGETFKYVAPVAGSFGFSLEDTATAIGTMANSGIKAEQAGTSLRRILTEMSHDIQLNGEAIGQFTVRTSNADGTMRNLSDILADLRVGWQQLSESEQAANATGIVGTNAMSGFLALMNSAPSDVEKLSDAISHADGTAKNMASTMLDNLQGDITLLNSAVDGFKISIAKKLSPELRDLVQYATSQIPNIQATFEPLTDFAIKTAKSIPNIVDNLQTLQPVISVVGTLTLGVFAGIKAAQITKKIRSELIPAVTSLWGVVSAHPLGAVLTAVGLVTAAATKGILSYLDTQLDAKSEMEILIDKHNEEFQLMLDKNRAIENLNKSIYENVGNIQNQTDRTKELRDELGRLADQYGNVQQKDKTRAEYILNELNNALGTEYTMTGNQIENYKQLSAEIDNVIAKKQAEMMLDAYLADSAEMSKNRIAARTDYENADNYYKTKKAGLEKLENRWKIFNDDFLSKETTVEDYLSGNLSDSDITTAEGLKIANDVLIARENLQQAKNVRFQARKNYEETSDYFEKLDDLQEAYSLEQYDRMADIIYGEKDLTNNTIDESATDAERRLKLYSDSLQKTISDFNLAVRDMRQKSVDEMEAELSDTMQKAMQAGIDPAEVWENFKDGFAELQAKGLDISPLVTPMIDSGMTPAQAFDDWQEVFKNQLANGGDMASMLKWLDNSGYYNSIPLIFGDNKDFTKYLKKQSASGTDISPMLELGIKSGLSESEDFVKIFKSTVSKNIANGWEVGNLLELGSEWGVDLGDEFGESFGERMATINANGIDLITFVKWAESQGKSVAEVFGENFHAELSAYLKTKNVIEDFKSFVENDPLLSFGKQTLSERIINAFANGKDLSGLSAQAQKNGLEIGTVFGEDFMYAIQEQLNSGYDIENLVKWAYETGETISGEYSDIYTEIVQGCIDKGYSIESLLKWGESSGFSTADTFGKKYSPEAQTFIDRGFAVDSLLAWARNTGINAGRIFGENFQNFANMYVEDKRKELQDMVDRGGFLGNYLGNIFGNLPFMADGGFLNSGQAIVAEAGPELLEVMNGGVKVTPLSRSAQNNPVSSSNIYYSSYTINATISGGYDVRRLTEDLETEKQRSNNGRGIR